MALSLDVFDVGQGDGLMVWLPGDKTMMVDLGSTKNKGLVSSDIETFFKEHTKFGTPNQTLDWLILTHGDRDHYNMVEDFLNTFQVNVGNVFHGGAASEYNGLIGWLKSRQNPDGKTVTNVMTGTGASYTSIPGLGAEVVILAAGVTAGSGEGYIKNTKSVVLRVRYAGKTLMLTGDATRDTESQIVAWLTTNKGADKVAAELATTVLKVAHHGSHRTSNHAKWIQLVNPGYAVISSDRSGTLGQGFKATGHRLPQSLTISLLHQYAKLVDGLDFHPYVMSYQASDYADYNLAPDIADEPVALPVLHSPDALQWIEHWSQTGMFSTLATIGTTTEAEDQGVQWRFAISDTGKVDVTSTYY